MPDSRKHRGPHPADARLFAGAQIELLRQAVGDLSWLLSRGYAANSALKLVGDRYRLTARQRLAVIRCSCAEEARVERRRRQVREAVLSGADLEVDGFNVLLTVEAALSGGIVLQGRDGCLRDLAGMHGSYRSVQETQPALSLIGGCLARSRVASVRWWLDRPVSNSGRLKNCIEELGRRHGWTWKAQLAYNPDEQLIQSPQIVASADALVLDHCGRWYNLAAAVVQREVPEARVIQLNSSEPSGNDQVAAE